MEKWFNQIEKKEVWYIILPLLLVIPLLSFSNQMYGVFQGDIYQNLKLVIQVLIIVFTMAIAIQSYLVFSHLLSNQTLYIGNIFFIIALLELVSLFFSQSTEWGYMDESIHILMRVYLSIGFLLIILFKRQQLSMNYRLFTYGSSLLFVIVSISLVYMVSNILSEQLLVYIDNMVHLFAIILQIITIVIVSRYLKKMPKRSMWLISAAISLIVSDVFFIFSQDQNAIWDFSALIYQFLAFYFFLKAIYYTSVEKPFQQLLKIKKDLEQSQEELRFQAYHDDITLLPNEHLLLKTLKENLHDNQVQKAIIAIEIDRFAAIRSSIGISNSNKMMKLVAERIQAIVPPHYFATKLREGQFVIYINHVKTVEELLQFCLNLKSAMKDPLQVQLFSLNGNLNMGIALYEDKWTGEELLMHAQLAMREARQIPQRFLFYKPYMSKDIADRILLEQDLHNALANNEFYLDYQPQVNLKTGTIESVEALARWRHPTRGFVPPDVFIPIAEECGLIIPLGKWILETACMQAKTWEKQGLPPMKVAVNLSLGQLFQQDLVEMVEEILQRTKLTPKYLQLEITESMTMNIDQMTQLLHELKALGIQIAVDDFGTGYSSLSYLKDFPIDCLKIDRTFVRNVPHNPNDEALVSMIISMAKHLRLKVVAEGIEEVEQLSFLMDGGCDYIQGYLFSKPISPQQISETYTELHHHIDEVLTQLQYIEDYII
ncbi:MULTISPECIES: EAL domain-containing protein [Lysinibacillus]|uniref:bifunctional diguanylate cyclase/phosphodiesterase n=1 Tax=Lysinibacillus TaxID=400634 RepID=UPI00088F0F86|nr:MULTISPECIES: EAL domain-containing protein [Lysinibacillus]MEE3805578.1 EAL domain-containing protein [Lysinibacillus fusiformis]WCH46704.1 EAL domain-containing protein [Lysinibacillus sp. OF-1]SCY99860.1 EAL domain, c-di-GMP-specific phosphodiesterase class I (or its enzymatically inactive variant) [Lysinibacillus sp. SG9]SDB46519.1 EAL domain, c-di-GMP-specific phosphodiesterase class I (or its enzymatically inactive variant) [Lysinibacillus sp. TC-37]SFT13043.1 EAL domain, c-di-GMP-spe